MRTKALLCAAALAAGAFTSTAQVYSANVVGYVNVPIAGGLYTMMANPLDATMGGTIPNGNNITNLFQAPVAQEGDAIYRWNVGNYDFDSHIYAYGSGHWATSFDANPGEGFWYISANADTTVTFVGQVIQGTWSYPSVAINGNAANVLSGGGLYNALGSPFPIGGSFTNSIIGIPATEGDAIYPWSVPDYDFASTIPAYGSGHWTHTDYQIAPGIGYIYVNANGDYAWTATFTVQ